MRRIGGMSRRVVGHQHVGIAGAVKDPRQLVHIDIALVGPDLDEVAQAPLDIAEVDVEDLLAIGEVFDDRR